MPAAKTQPNQKAQKLGAGAIAAKLAKKYEAPAWAFLAELRNGTGYSRRETYADAVAMSLWPSRGLDLLGFEIKCDRSDWMAELKNPSKAHEIQRFCTYWWLVVNDASIVIMSELPPNWGLMAMVGPHLKVIKDAPRLEPEPPSLRFIASILRNYSENFVSKSMVAQVSEEKLEEQIKRRHDGNRQQLERLQKDHAALTKRVADFHKASGIDLSNHSYNFAYHDATKIGEVVKELLNGQHKDAAAIMKQAADYLDRLRDVAAKAASVLSAKIEEQHGTDDT